MYRIHSYISPPMKLLKNLLILLIFSSSCIMAQNTEKDDFQWFTLVPVLGYNEETHFQYGAMGILFMKPNHPGGKVPEIGLSAFGTTRGQFQLYLEPYYYLFHDKISVWTALMYQNWFASYFGSGNAPHIDTYTNYDREKFYFGNIWESAFGVPKYFKYGVEIHIEHTDVEFREDGELELPDPHSGWRNGAGYLISFDSRDITNWSRHGFFVQWKQKFYSNRIGDYTFDTESLDLCGYTTLPWKASFAQGFLWKRSGGDVPFDKLAGPDGTRRFRGVESLYFNGKQAIISQSEVRRYFAHRVGAHVFFESGKAGDYFSDLMREKWHKSVGIGALLGLNMSEQLFARADLSWVDFDHFGVTLNLRQAF